MAGVGDEDLAKKGSAKRQREDAERTAGKAVRQTE
jgi:hypothetical protein